MKGVFLCFMKQTQKEMKARVNTTAVRYVLVGFLMILATTLTAQTGTVWARVSNISSLELTTTDGRMSSSNSSIQKMISDLDVVSVEKAFTATRSRSLSNVYEITCNCNENDLLSGLAKLSTYFQSPELVTSPEVLYTPNDFSLSVANDYALNLINAQGAWDITRGDSSVVIAITDANFYLLHEELVGQYSYVSSNSNTNYAHGTAVAITAAGNTNNGIGKSSIGYNSTLQLRAMTFNEVLEASYSGAKVVNMSWSSGCYFNAYAQQVIDEAYSNGTILVASAGNGGTCGGASNLVYPASYDHVIAVSSVGPLDNHERFYGDATSTHQHNATVDICAPGYDVALSTAPGVYVTGNGTSFASPYVSGTIALMLSVNPCLTPDQVEYILKQTAVNIDAMNPSYVGLLGAGRLDASAAVRMASTFSTAILTAETVSECEHMTQSIVLDLSNIAAPYSINWNNGSTDSVLTNVAVGNYSALVRDANGCVGYYATSIDTLMPIAVDAAVTAVVCNGTNTGSIEAVVTGGHSGYSYIWSTGSTTSSTNDLVAGTYTLTVTDVKGCIKETSIIVTEPAGMTASLDVVDAFTANDANLDVTINGGTAPYSYTWNTGAVTEDLSGMGAGFYELLVTDANGCQVSLNAEVNDQTITEHTTEDAPLAADTRYTTEGQELNTTDVAGITAVEETVETGVYPNPATDRATVTWAGATVERVVLMNMQGQMIQQLEVVGGMDRVELTGVATGEYLVQVITKAGTQKVQRVIFM
jgi:hypothetical protein